MKNDLQVGRFGLLQVMNDSKQKVLFLVRSLDGSVLIGLLQTEFPKKMTGPLDVLHGLNM